MKVLMISGKSASGKDTVAEYMKNVLTDRGARVLVIHFGDFVKALLRAYYNWNGNKNEEGRALLQHFATGQVRSKYPTYWADVVSKFISSTEEDWDYVIIPDWRFINEYETICEDNENVITIRVDRRNSDGTYYFNPQMTHNQIWHQSEIELDGFPFEWIIENVGDLDQLYDSAIMILDEVCR